MGDTLQVNDSSMQALAAYLQKTLEPSTRHEGMGVSHVSPQHWNQNNQPRDF